MAPGTYEVDWQVSGFQISESLGKIDVLPRSEFKARHCFVPDSAFPGQEIPVALEGLLECSYPLRNVDISWNGKRTGLVPEFFQIQRESNGLYVYEVGVLGVIPFSEGSLQHRLELEFRCENALLYTWRHFQAIAIADTRPHTLARKEIGDLDPKSGSVSIHVRGAVLAEKYERSPGADVGGQNSLRSATGCDGHRSGADSLVRNSVTDRQGSRRTWEFSLGLKKQGRSPEVFVRWQNQIRLMEPIIHVELLETRLPEGKTAPYFLGVCGWVEHHALVDRLLLKLDGEVVATLAISHFRADVAAHLGETLVKRQGFHTDVVLNASPGNHVVQLVAVQERGHDAVWESPLALEDPSVAGFLLKSTDLDELENNDACTFWSSISVSGEVMSQIMGVVATLQVDGKTVDRQDVGSGSFALSFAPGTPGRHSVRVQFRSGERTLYDSGAAYVNFIKLEISGAVPATLDHFTDRFDLRSSILLPESKDLAHILVQREREVLPEFLDMLQEISISLEHETNENTTLPLGRMGSEKSLKVLFACWEVPSLRHGGGVWMTNLLRQFHGKHDVTLIHAYGPGEEGWVDDVRPYVRKVISVPRMHQPALYRGDARIPAAYYDDYTPELRAAIEAEIFVGNYDIVNYEYTKMFSHMSRADIAQVMIVHENAFSAQLSNLTQNRQSGPKAIKGFLDLLNTFYFLTGALPRSCEDIVGLTKEDAAVLNDFQRRARVHLNTIGVETDFPVPEEAPRILAEIIRH